MTSPTVRVVGAGIAGIACARALHDGGVGVTVLDRGHRPGGRLSSRRIEGRPVELGAPAFTAKPDTAFGALVEDWVARGLARVWTDRFSSSATTPGDRETHPHFVATGSLRDLIADLATGLDVQQGNTVERIERSGESLLVGGATIDAATVDAVVLAMPDPQAARLLAPHTLEGGPLTTTAEWDATITVALGFDERRWPADLHALTPSDSSVVTLVADDGDRNGDGAPVLVAHTTHELAAAHLTDPDAVIAPVTAEVARLLGTDVPPTFSLAHRWTFAEAAAPHDEAFLLDRSLGVCGDSWGGRSSVGRAWSSGDALGRELVRRLT